MTKGPWRRRLERLEALATRLTTTRLLLPVIGLAAALFVLLSTIGGLLASIESGSSRSFGPSVFTGFRILVYETDEFGQALDLWLSDDGRAARGMTLLMWHLGADLAFIVVYGLLLWAVLRAAHVRREFAARLAMGVVAVDLLETTVTLIAVGAAGADVPGWILCLIQSLALLKWIGLALAVVAVVLARVPGSGVGQRAAPAAAPGGAGDDSAQAPPTPAERAAATFARVQTGTALPSGFAVAGQAVLVGLLVLVLAVPLGGALDQVPDIVRFEIQGASWPVIVGLVLSVLLCIAAVVASAVVGGAAASTVNRTPLPPLAVVAGAVLVSGLLASVRLVRGEEWNPAVLAPTIVAGLITLAGRMTKAIRSEGQEGTGLEPREAPPEEGSKPGFRPYGDRDLWWIGTLAGILVIAFALAVIRAAAPFVVLQIGIQWRWWGIFAAALLACTGGALAAVMLSRKLADWSWPGTRLPGRGVAEAESSSPPGSERFWRRWAALPVWIIFGASIAAAGLFAVDPEAARFVGATGSLAISFAFFAVVIALFQWQTRRGRPWRAMRLLGFGPRTPWALVLVATWVLASVLSTAGGFHAARVAPVRGDDGRYANLQQAFMAWQGAQGRPGCEAETPADVPMVLVAAPGGGGRAAYWTANALESIFPDECARRRVFAVSATSGGSVGATVWVGAAGTSRRAEDAIDAVVDEDALAATFAGLFLRDLPQPLTGMTSIWRDRAAILEDVWIERSDVLGTVGSPTPWSELGAQLPWKPVLVLNASSVTDGCRVLITNVARLPASPSEDCLWRGGVTPAAPESRGPVRASIDPLVSLVPSNNGDNECREGARTGPAQTPLAVTAALLSARFPYVTPSGALYRCTRSGLATTYAVDGGYFENSGLLALIEMLDELRPELQRDASTVEPWILLLDNHYRSSAAVAAPERPLEVLVPPTALGAAGVSSGQSALEQAAARAVNPDLGTCRFARIGPTVLPGISAPLGWVLSEATRNNLDTALRDALTPGESEGDMDEDCATPLLQELGSTTPD